MPKVEKARQATLIHNLGIIYQRRGDHGAAFAEYEKSLKIAEELGDRAGVALSHGQMGTLFIETEKFPEAFAHLLFALSIFVELQSPKAQMDINFLKTLRQKWGAKKFDAAWRKKSGEAVPEAFK